MAIKHVNLKGNFLFIILSILGVIPLIAQHNETNVNIDSYLQKSKKLIQQHPDSSRYFAGKALELSYASENDTLIAKALLQLSSVLIVKREFAKADSILHLNLQKELPENIKGSTLHNLGSIKYYQQDFQHGLDYFFKAVEILEKSNDTTKMADSYANIGSINAILKNFDNAQKYLEKALPLSKDKEILRLKILVNLSNIYLDQKQYEKFGNNIFEAEKLAKKTNAKRSLAVINNNISNYYRDHKNDYDLAIAYGKKSIRIKKELKLLQNLSINYNNVGYSYLKKREFTNAIIYLDSALYKAKGTLKSYVLNNIKDAYIGLQDYKTAMSYTELRDQIKDSIVLQQQKEKVTELIEQYESEKKQQQINNLAANNKVQALIINQQKYQMIGLLILTGLLLLLGYFGFRIYKTKQQLATVLLRQRLLKTQLNPHFLFNALQSIQSFIYQNEKEKSISYLANYSKLIRMILEKSDHEFCTVEEDASAIVSYLNLQQLNATNAFDYTVEVDDTIDPDFDTIPTLITQPFVENAVVHGVKNLKNGCISVQYYKNETNLMISIKDNGAGFSEKVDPSKKLHTSMSSKIIEEQFHNLSKSNKQFSATIDIKSSDKGTEVVLCYAFKNN